MNLDINGTANIPDFCPLHPSFDDHTGCRYFHDSIQVLQSHATIVINEINHYRSILSTSINNQKHTRTKRGLINGAGILFKHLFGSATDSDIAKLQNEIDTIENGLHNYTKGFVSAMDSLHSMEVHTNKRISNIRDGLNYTSHMLNTTIIHLKKLTQIAKDSQSAIYVNQLKIESLRHLTNLLNVLQVTHGTNLDVLLYQTKYLTFALSELMRSVIPISLIEPRMIIQAMDSIQFQLLEKWPMFRVAVKDYHEIYSINDVKYSISKNNLYVTVGIPITLQESIFDVYQVTTMHIAVSNNVNTQLSKLSNVADYLAINSDHSYFLDLSSVDLLHCKGSDVKRCWKPFVFNYADIMTCT